LEALATPQRESGAAGLTLTLMLPFAL